MVTKEECKSLGMIFVKSHKDGKGSWTKAYCRELTKKELARKEDIKETREFLKYMLFGIGDE